ncbi:MAG: hypothetical protein ABIJ47_16215 [Candidatus Bathyarchaeota archaeon]
MEELTVIARHSYQELLDLLLWFHHQGPTPILIGGWAVYLYNSYTGSVDVDLVGPSMGGLFDATLESFERERGYQPVVFGPMGLGTSFRKPIIESGELHGYMEIDACTYENDNRVFKENPLKELPYELCSREGMTAQVLLDRSCEALIPVKPLLFLYKLKALRDRQYDLREQGAVLGYERAAWLRSKMVKDGSDLISLLDSGDYPRVVSQRFDSSILRKIIDEYDLGFIVESIESLPLMYESRQLYRNIDESAVKQWVIRILDELQ